MANYYIIGGDQKEYGPVTGAELRQWISEGRLDANSKARTENETDWRPLSSFLEFSPLFQPKAPPSLYPLHSPAPAVSEGIVKAPAIALIIYGALAVLESIREIINAFAHPMTEADVQQGTQALSQAFGQETVKNALSNPLYQFIIHLMENVWFTAALCLFGLVISVVILVGAVKMLKLQNHEFAMVAAIVAIIPCFTPCICCFLGIPIGIWAVMVLRKPGVKNLFH